MKLTVFVAPTAVVSLLLACAGRGEAPVVGVSHGMPPQGNQKDAGGPLPFPFVDGGVDTTGFVRLSPESYNSVGHASGRFSADVYANELAAPIFRQGVGAFPIGATLLMVHRERRPSPSAEAHSAGAISTGGPTFRMQKTEAGWRYATVSKTGALLAEGTPDSCVGCHEDAPRDHVFPLLVPR